MNKGLNIEIGEEVFTSRSEFERYLEYDRSDASWKTKEEDGGANHPAIILQLSCQE